MSARVSEVSSRRIHAARMWAATGLAMLMLSLLATPAQAQDADPDGIGISVPVIGPTPAAVAANTAPSGTGRGGITPAAPAAVAANTVAPEPAAGDMLIAGGLYVGDINGGSRPTMNPWGGVADTWITLRNLSSETIDLSADFSLATVTGARISGDEVDVRALKPGETRVVGTSLEGTGQWPFVVARVTVVPPEVIAGSQTAPVSRAGIIYVFPWLGAIGLVVIAVAMVLLRVAVRPPATATIVA